MSTGDRRSGGVREVLSHARLPPVGPPIAVVQRSDHAHVGMLRKGHATLAAPAADALVALKRDTVARLLMRPEPNRAEPVMEHVQHGGHFTGADNKRLAQAGEPLP